MPNFSYVARSRGGEKVEGSVEANDRRGAMAQIERLGHVPISVKEGRASAKPAGKNGKGKGKAKPGAKEKPVKRARFKLEKRSSGKTRKLKTREVLQLTREMSDLLASGMTLGNALHTLSRRKGEDASNATVEELRDEIVQGTSLSEALAKRPESFSPLYIAMVRAGEASGQLSEVLERLSFHFERVQEAQEKVMTALIYPAIVCTMGLGTMIFAVVFVVPRFESIFAELGSTLPLPTRILIGFSRFLTDPVYGTVLVVGIFLLIYGLRRFLKSPTGIRTWHRTQLRLPVVKNIVNSNAYAHFARTLGALLANGVPVLQALTIVEDTVGNTIISQQINEARDRVTDGATISGPLAEGKVFPPLLTDMLAVGEESGDMSGALKHIAKRYDDELDRNVKIFTTVLEPIMILFMAVMVGFIAISMLLAVFDLTTGLDV